MPTGIETTKQALDDFKKIQEYMLLAKKENAVETYAKLKDEYLTIKALLQVSGVNLTDIDKIKEWWNIPVSEAKKKANKKWENTNCKQIRLVLPNEQAERLDKHCQETGQSKNGFIKSAIDEKLNREEK